MAYQPVDSDKILTDRDELEKKLKESLDAQGLVDDEDVRLGKEVSDLELKKKELEIDILKMKSERRENSRIKRMGDRNIEKLRLDIRRLEREYWHKKETDKVKV